VITNETRSELARRQFPAEKGFDGGGVGQRSKLNLAEVGKLQGDAPDHNPAIAGTASLHWRRRSHRLFLSIPTTEVLTLGHRALSWSRLPICSRTSPT
jgi:hypothetical protein